MPEVLNNHNVTEKLLKFDQRPLEQTRPPQPVTTQTQLNPQGQRRRGACLQTEGVQTHPADQGAERVVVRE